VRCITRYIQICNIRQKRISSTNIIIIRQFKICCGSFLKYSLKLLEFFGRTFKAVKTKQISERHSFEVKLSAQTGAIEIPDASLTKACERGALS
jgi:hypothetical protein